MATNLTFIQFVCEQIKTPLPVRYKKMFGEYMVYINEKPLLLVCDNTVFVKMVPELLSVMQNAPTGYPYGGAKLHHILDVEDEQLTDTVLSILESVTPLPVKK